jgi:YD repeat-containing protein
MCRVRHFTPNVTQYDYDAKSQHTSMTDAKNGARLYYVRD